MAHEKTPVNGLTELNEHEIRIEKIKKMQEQGISPWPEYKPVSTTIAKGLAEFLESGDESKHYEVAGRLLTRRDHGKTFFCNIKDRSGTVQIYLKKDEIGEKAFDHFKHHIDSGDTLWVKGFFFKTKAGEVTIHVKELTLLSKSLHPLPEKYHGLADVEQRYRQRYLDLISNQESADKFKKRSGIIQSIRQFLHTKDFIEVETPMLHPIPGGAVAKPFITHHNAYDIDLYLRIAPELYLKRLVVGGFERVFEINRNFRNEGVSTRHNPEFTMLEFYMAHGDYKNGMELTEQLLQQAVLHNFPTLKVQFGPHELNFEAPFKKMTIYESLIQIGGLKDEQLKEATIDALIHDNNVELPEKNPDYGVKLFALFEHFVEEKIVQPTFIIGYPISVSPLSKRDPNDTTQAARFELFVCGMELANGFTELNDPFDQAQRFKDQVASREGGNDEAHHYDAEYIHALEYGLPPTVGVGIGIDRLTMLLTNTQSIKDVILFPTMKPSQQS